MERYFAGYLGGLKIDKNEFLGLGRQHPRDHSESSA